MIVMTFQDREKLSIQLAKEDAVAIRQPDSSARLTSQHNQLISERRVIAFKSAPRLE